MTNFEKIRNEAKKVFFKNKNFYECLDFMFDFKDNKLIPCYNDDVKSNGSCVSFAEYGYISGINKDITSLILKEYYESEEDYTNFVKRVEKLFDDSFEEFYYNIMNMNVDISCVGTIIHKYYTERVKSVMEAIEYYSNGYTD